MRLGAPRPVHLLLRPKPQTMDRHRAIVPPRAARRLSALQQWISAHLSVLLDFAWLGSLGAVAALASAGAIASFAAPYAHAGTTRHYALGEYIDFRPGGDARHFLHGGWGTPRAEGTRTTG